jgi:fructosamine-3-kinase
MLHPDLFEREYNGLNLLKEKEKETIKVPKPFFYGQTAEYHFLVIEFIEKSAADPSFWEIFARGIAEMHRHSQDRFGLKEDNYIGPLPQPNRWHTKWADFYASQRLEPMIRKCINESILEKEIAKNTDRLYARLPEIFPEEKPALVHGDLWGGNYLPGPSGQPYIFDPAVYYGHREMDLAMARLFGGFDRRFYWHYEEYFPLAPGWQERIPLCQLYPLLVHSLLFGGGYVQQVRYLLSEW